MKHETNIDKLVAAVEAARMTDQEKKVLCRKIRAGDPRMQFAASALLRRQQVAAERQS
jgi:hypothetical protein